MIIEEFQSKIQIGDICKVCTNIQSNHDFSICGVVYEGCVNDKVEFRIQNGNLTFQIPLASIVVVHQITTSYYSILFKDH